MVFVSFANRAKYVIAGHPRRKVMDPSTGFVIPYPGLEARFMGHRFDSVQQQREKGWTDEQRKTVENYLLQHRDFDSPGGIHLEVVDGESKLDVIRAAGHADITLAATDEKRRCVAWIRNERNESELCPNEATVGDLCAQHAGMVPVAEDEEGSPEIPAADVPEPETVVPRRAFALPRVGV